MFLSAAREGLPAANALRRSKQWGVGVEARIRYQNSPRHYLEVEHWGYAKQLERLVAELRHEPTWAVHALKLPAVERERSARLRVAA